MERDDSLSGGEGSDALAGGSGNDVLAGGAGNDALAGDDGDDVLTGGAGADYLVGNQGADTYTFSAGDGEDTIDEKALIAVGVADEASTDVVRFDAAVNAADVALLRQANGDLVVRYGAADSVTIAGQYAGAAQAIERIEFADGTVFDKAALDALPLAPIAGTPGDDVLAGTLADDMLVGGSGADSYSLYLGMGRDTLVDGSPSSAEIGTLSLAEGLTLDSLKARQAGNDLAIDIRGTADGVLIKDYFSSTQVWQIADAGGSLTPLGDLIDRPDPYADEEALGAREDFRNGLLSSWRTLNTVSGLPQYAYVFSSWSQTTSSSALSATSPWTTVVEPPVTHTSIEGYGVRDGAEIVDTSPLQHSISTQLTSQSSDDAEIHALTPGQSSVELVPYGVTLQVMLPFGADDSSSTSTFATGPLSFNTVVSRTTQGWAPITLTPGGGAEYDANLSVERLVDIRSIEQIDAGASDNVIYGAEGIAAGHVALIDAGEGNDTVWGGVDDFAYGNEGDDFIDGGSLAYGGNGADTITNTTRQYGGAGNDTLASGLLLRSPLRQVLRLARVEPLLRTAR